MKRPTRLLALAAVAAAAAACGGSSSSGSSAARMSVHLVDGPGEYEEVNLHVLRVEIQGDAGWTTLGTVDRTIDLLHLVNGVEETLVDGATLPAGHYGMLRLVLGDGNTVKTADGLHDLVVPSGLQSGVKLPGSFDVAPGTTKDVFIDLDAHRSVFVHRTGASDKYILRPVVRSVDRIVTGSITGTLTDAATHAPLAGVDVTAQRSLDTGPAVARATRTDATGRYVLDLLRLSDGPYHVVSQPVVAGAVYAACASPAIPLTEAAPTPAWDAAFTAAAEHGGIGGAITPAATADQADLVDVSQALDVGGGATRSFLLRTAAGVVSATGERYDVTDLPAGTYAVSLVRSTLDASGNETLSGAGPAAATVAGGATANVPLAVH